MNRKPIEQAKDADLRGAKAALQRAADTAARLAQQTGTRLITVDSVEAAKRETRPEAKAGG
jgi:Flp pilus assembly protein TadG